MDRVVSIGIEESFIERLAAILQREFLKNGFDLSSTTVVFGGRRPALFLKKELARLLGKPFLPARLLSMDEFVLQCVSAELPCSLLPPLEACYRIYRIVQASCPRLIKDRADFAAFLPWSREIAAFLDQLDLEEVASPQLENIRSGAKIGFDVMEEVNVLLREIIVVRETFRRSQEQQRRFSRGYLYRQAAEAARTGRTGFAAPLIFAGFFSLHKAERTLLKSLLENEIAHLVFQGSAEEWPVLRELEGELGVSIRSPLPEKRRQPQIRFYRGFDAHSQVGIARTIVASGVPAEHTAVILPNTEKLIPLLSELSSVAEGYNVSLGYPLKRTALYAFFDEAFRAQLSRRADGCYYARDYLRVLAQPFVKNARIPHAAWTRVLVHKIEELLSGSIEAPASGSLFISLAQIEGSGELFSAAMETLRSMNEPVEETALRAALRQLHAVCFCAWESPRTCAGLSEAILQALDFLLQKSSLCSYAPNRNAAERLMRLAEELGSAEFAREEFRQEELFRVFLDGFRNEMVSFSGSPLKGVQVLGLLETRSLTFDTVVMLDVNESSMPKLRIYEPLIPRDVMISLGIDRLEQEEQIQRYQFLRLLRGAQEVHLIYEENDRCERSRFIEELIWEREKAERAVGAVQVPLACFSVSALPAKRSIRKTAAMAAALEAHRYSASSVNLYLACPVRFYFQYVLGLREREDSFDEPEQVDIGDFLHELLKLAYEPFLGARPLWNQQGMQRFFGAFDALFEQRFARRMKSDAFLLKELMRYRLEEFLRHETARTEVARLLALEKDYPVLVEAGGKVFSFICKVDRVDECDDGRILVIDYKSGSTGLLPAGRAKLASLPAERAAMKAAIKSFQMPLYLHCMRGVYPGREVDVALYSLRSAEMKTFPGAREAAYKDEILQRCLSLLGALLLEIIDPAVDFSADESDAQSCQRCPYVRMCR